MYGCCAAHEIGVNMLDALDLHQAVFDALRVEHRLPIGDFKRYGLHDQALTPNPSPNGRGGDFRISVNSLADSNCGFKRHFTQIESFVHKFFTARA
jgi:hypothetical protein